MRHARYRGRHRKSSAAARLTAVGAVGVGTAAVSVISPVAAHAATSVQWDRIAQCESGGNWHDDTGNGYYGGLQFAPSTWTSFDVQHFASRADYASRSQQIDVANRVLSSEGWGAWPVCSQYRGEPGPADAHPHHAKGHKAHHVQTVSAHHFAALGGHQRWTFYTVKSGDTLVEIARKHNVKGGWHELYRLNRHLIGDNPSVIHTGMKLKFHRV